MAPSIPTYRPLMTPTRAAILVAVVAVASSVFLAVDSAHSRTATALLTPSDWACADLAAVPASRQRVAGAGAGNRPSPLR